MDTLTSMEVFTQVVDSGGFSKAARQMGLSPAAASKHVAALERRLGVRLINRTTRRLNLTEAGLSYYQHCSDILERVHAANERVGLLAVQPKGRLRVNAPLSFGIVRLRRAIPAFLDRFPELELDLNLNDRVVDLVEEGFDMAIRIADRLEDSSLINRPLTRCATRLVASPQYLRRRGEPVAPPDLAGHNCLTYSHWPSRQYWHFASPDGHTESVRVDGSLHANNGEVLCEAAVRGTGIALLPDFIAEKDLTSKRLVPLLQHWSPPRLQVHAVYPYTRHLSAKVRAFVDFLAEYFGADA